MSEKQPGETATIDDILPARSIPAGWLVTARSHLIDRYRADCEIIALPRLEIPGGPWQVRSGTISAVPPRRRFRRPKEHEIAPADRWILDLRHRAPSNWSHFLNNHLPLFFRLAQMTGRDPDQALLLLPGDIPDYIRAAVAMFGLTDWPTDAVVEGEGVEFDLDPWVMVRNGRYDWAALDTTQSRLERAIAAAEKPPLPRRVFLSRQGTRVARNLTEIETLLSQKGFQTVYPETLPVVQQMRLFREAEEMVAIHGAGLAPLGYCRSARGHGPRRLVEIQPAGLMSNAFREMAGHAGCTWVGVRGRIKPRYIAPAYDLTRPMTQFSFDEFEIDPVAVEEALRLLDHPPPALTAADLNRL